MVAGAWKIFNNAKFGIGDGSFGDLDANAYRIALFQSAGTLISAGTDITIQSSVSAIQAQVANGNGYVTGGAAMANPSWTALGATIKFDGDDVVWTATGGTIPNIKTAVIVTSIAANSGLILAFSTLTTTQFTLGTGNTLTIQMDGTDGVFTLV